MQSRGVYAHGYLHKKSKIDPVCNRSVKDVARATTAEPLIFHPRLPLPVVELTEAMETALKT